jgi:hypothetical protein
MTTHEDAPGSFAELASKAAPMKTTPPPSTAAPMNTAPSPLESPSLRAGDALKAFPGDADAAVASLRSYANGDCVKTETLPDDHGIGGALDDALQGGLRPKTLIGIGATSAKAGKTGLAMQLVDGLALRTAALLSSDEAGPLTPVFMLSEMTPVALNIRTFARWTRTPYRKNEGLQKIAEAAESLLAKDHPDPTKRIFREAMEHRRIFDRLAIADSFRSRVYAIDLLKRALDEAADFYRADGRDVWPIVFVDPIHRWLDTSRPEVEGLGLLADTLRTLADDCNAIVIITSDTNKDNGTGRNNSNGADERFAGAARGSYQLIHSIDVGVLLETADGDKKGESSGVKPKTAQRENPVREATMKIAAARWGSSVGDVRFTWMPAEYRFTPRRDRPLFDGTAG